MTPPLSAAQPLLSVQDLRVRVQSKDMDVSIVNGVSFDVRQGETLCLLGESGSGKSVTLRALMRLLPHTARLSGRVCLDGKQVLDLNPGQLMALRGGVVSMVFQEPLTAFDPVFTIGQQIVETVRWHERIGRAQARARALELLELVQIPSAARRLDAYPHELSGGLRQRAMIALALSCRPKLLLADEPTTALDASVQIQILLLLRRLQEELGMATIIVTHDLGVAAEMADRLAVMYAGRFVETGDLRAVLREPRHPYTRSLLASTLMAGSDGGKLEPIPGSPPDLASLPPGCSFAPRCSEARPACLAAVPPLQLQEDGRGLRCPRMSHASAH